MSHLWGLLIGSHFLYLQINMFIFAVPWEQLMLFLPSVCLQMCLMSLCLCVSVCVCLCVSEQWCSWASMHNNTTLELPHLNGIQPLITLWIAWIVVCCEKCLRNKHSCQSSHRTLTQSIKWILLMSAPSLFRKSSMKLNNKQYRNIPHNKPYEMSVYGCDRKHQHNSLKVFEGKTLFPAVTVVLLL